MRVLYLNHTGAVSGAERSLLDLVTHLPDGVEPVIASPAGPLHDAARAAGIEVREIAGVEASLKTSAARTPGVLLGLAGAGWATGRLARSIGADLVHANSIRAGLTASVAARTGGPPAVAHLRDTLPTGALTRGTLGLIALGCTAVIGNSQYTADAFTRVTRRHRGVRAIVNPIDLKRFDPGSVDRSAARRAFDLDPDAFAIGIVGQITPWKGQSTAVRAFAAAHATMPHARLLVVGETKFVTEATRFDNRTYRAELDTLVRDGGLADAVRFLGERQDIPELMRALDVLLVPSWEEPFGRVVVEGMAMGATVVATAIGGPAEIITDGVDGLLLDPHAVDRWAATLRDLHADADARLTLAAAGRQRAAAFDVAQHVAAVVRCYDWVLDPVATPSVD